MVETAIKRVEKFKKNLHQLKSQIKSKASNIAPKTLKELRSKIGEKGLENSQEKGLRKGPSLKK